MERVRRMLFRNKKRRCITYCVLLLSLLCSGCGNDSADLQPNSKVETGAEELEAVEETVRQLFQKNIDCMTNIFCINQLPYEEETMRDGHVCKVSEERFADYGAFAAYIQSVYCTEEAERLLQDFPYEGEPMYLEIDGALYVDLHLVGGKGYYVDWTDCAITIDALTAEKCEFTAKGVIEEPAEEPTQEAYTVSGTAVQENGQWVLEKMIY